MSSGRRRLLAKSAIAGGMLLLWLGTQAVLTSPELHHFLHKDSRDPNHSCLITKLLEHSPTASATVIVVPLVVGVLLILAVGSSELRSADDLRLSPSRAPPQSCFLLFA
jgi:hypothetical protein